MKRFVLDNDIENIIKTKQQTASIVPNSIK